MRGRARKLPWRIPDNQVALGGKPDALYMYVIAYLIFGCSYTSWITLLVLGCDRVVVEELNVIDHFSRQRNNSYGVEGFATCETIKEKDMHVLVVSGDMLIEENAPHDCV